MPSLSPSSPIASPSSSSLHLPQQPTSSYNYRLTPNLTGPAGAAISSVLSLARYLDDPEISLNLSMLRNVSYFDTIVEQGFFTNLSEAERAVFRADLDGFGASATGATSSGSSSTTASTISLSAASSPSKENMPSPVMPSSRPKSSRSSSYAEERHSIHRIVSFPSVAAAAASSSSSALNLTAAEMASSCNRESTLKLTLTPESMRADEAVLYGWQRDHIASNFSASQPDPETDYATLDDVSESQFIPAGGLGADVSSSKKVRRVFGKLRRPRPTPNAYMITSSDV